MMTKFSSRKPGRVSQVVYGLQLQVRFWVRFALATRKFTFGLALALETENRYLDMTHSRVCTRATKNSVSSLDHHGEAMTLGYQ